MKLVICRGLPASGKSTYAKQLVDSLGYKRVNKDELRAMIDNGTYSTENEQLVHLAQIAMITTFLTHREPVVVDNTHGSERIVRRLKALAESYDYEVEIKVFDTPLEECIKRDASRTNSVGEHAIRRLACQGFFQQLYKTA